MKFDLVEYNQTEDTCRFIITGRERRRKPAGSKTFTALDLTPLSNDLDGARFGLEHYLDHMEQIDLMPTRIIVGDSDALLGVVNDVIGEDKRFSGEFNKESFIDDLKTENIEGYDQDVGNVLVTIVPE